MKEQFARFLDYRKAAIKSSTTETYRTDQAAFFRWTESKGLTVRNIQRVHIAEWMAHAQTIGQSNGVIMARLAILRAFFAWAQDNGLRSANPVELKKLPRLKASEPNKQPFTDAEFGRVLEASTQPGIRPFWPAAIQIGWSTGLRMSDVAGLLWGEIDMVGRTITRKAMKTGATRAIPIDSDLQFALIRLYNEPERVASLFVLPAMNALYQQARTQLCGQFKAICERAGVQNGHFHRFRHSFASRLINSGVDSLVVSAMTGQSLKILKGYSHISIDAKRQALGIKPGENAVFLLTKDC